MQGWPGAATQLNEYIQSGHLPHLVGLHAGREEGDNVRMIAGCHCIYFIQEFLLSLAHGPDIVHELLLGQAALRDEVLDRHPGMEPGCSIHLETSRSPSWHTLFERVWKYAKLAGVLS